MARKFKNIFLFAMIIAIVTLTFTDLHAANALDGVKVFGYGQAWYISDDSNVASDKITSEFLIRRARLGAKTNSNVGPFSADFKFMGEFAGHDNSTETPVTHDSGRKETVSDEDTGSAILLDAYINLKYSPLFQFQVGQFKYHFTEIGTASSKINSIGLIDRPEMAQNIHGRIGSSKLRDVGVRIHGSINREVDAGYDIEYLNGDGLNSSDSNDDRTLIFHAYVEEKGLKLFGAYFTGKEGTKGSEFSESGWTAGGKYTNGPVSILGEYATAKYESGPVAVEPNGWYVQTTYDVVSASQVLARYGVVEADSNTSNTTMTTTIFGTNYKVGKNITVSVNYIMRNADSAYSKKTLLGRAGSTMVTGGDIGGVVVTQFEYAF